MPRTSRAAVGGVVYHVLNRGNGRMRIFRKPQDYLAFVGLLGQALQRVPGIELFSFCLMPNHWHLVLRPKGDRDLAAFMFWLTNTHVKRYRAHYPRTSGHLYQGRFKSFPIERDEHFLIVARYVEANPLRAKLVPRRRAQDWTYSSLVLSVDPNSKLPLLSEWPVDRPDHWLAIVNDVMPEAQAERVRASIQRDRPFGGDRWSTQIAAKLGLGHTFEPRGRPRKLRSQRPASTSKAN
jgi:putative transposase